MTNDQAKFLLQACRSRGQDSSDPAFAEALEQANRDPLLRAWLERERAFDAEVVAKVKNVRPPDSLRASILAGARASRPGNRWLRASVGIGMAAAIALASGLFAFNRLHAKSAVPLDDLVQTGLSEMNGAHPRGQPLDMLAELGPWLADASNRLGTSMPVDLESLRSSGCRSLNVGGREVFEICFRRESWLHLYVARRGDFMCRECEIQPMFREQGELGGVTWVDDDHVFLLVSRAGLDAVKAAVADPATIALR